MKNTYKNMWDYISSLENRIEIENYLGKLQLEYDCYTSDSFRCDYCESCCNCDSDKLNDLSDSVIKKFPELKNYYWEIKDYIYGF